MKETPSKKKNIYQVLVKRTDKKERSWLEWVEVEPFLTPLLPDDLRFPTSQLMH